MTQLPSKIAIIGVGLIGGSVAMGLKNRLGSKITIMGSCSDSKRVKEAKNRGIIDHEICRDISCIKDVDLVIIATPILTVCKILEKMGNISGLKPLTIDVGSTKLHIENFVRNNLANPVNFVGTHPMAGSEMNGFENADPNLFQNKPWIICPLANTKKEDLDSLTGVFKSLGAKPMIIDAKLHDEISTFASHIHLVISNILIQTISKEKKWDKIARIASTGFRDTTRLASQDPRMKLDILLTNKNNILNSLNKLKKEITRFSGLLNGNENDLLRFLTDTKSVRDNWLLNNFS